MTLLAGPSLSVVTKVVPGACAMKRPNGSGNRSRVTASVWAVGAEQVGGSGHTVQQIARDLPVDGIVGGADGGPYIVAIDEEYSPAPAKTNWGWAKASYNAPGGPAKDLFVDSFFKGIAYGTNNAPSRGFEIEAIGDTALSDSFHVTITAINATSASLVINGEALLQRNITAPAVGRFDVMVYPDTVAADLDVTRSGAGALFVGRLMVDRDGIEKADGGWVAGDFQVQVTADRARIRAVNLTKVINCPNSALLATEISATGSAAAVPSATPLTVAILSLLLAGGGWMVLRRRNAMA